MSIEMFKKNSIYFLQTRDYRFFLFLLRLQNCPCHVHFAEKNIF